MDSSSIARSTAVKEKLYSRLLSRLLFRSSKRLIRYLLLGANIVFLGAVVAFILRSPSRNNQVISQNSLAGDNSSLEAVNPLDQVSSADIAVHIARLVSLDEAVSVTNQADSVNAQLSFVPAASTVVAKPQIVATALKSKNDIKRYLTVAGDTVSDLAGRFGVTSESIKWSNGLTGNNLSANTELFIPPVNGVVYVVKAGDTVDSVAQKFLANRDQVVVANDAEISGLKVGDRILIPDGSIAPVSRSTSVNAFYAGYAFGTTAQYGSNGYDYGWCTWYASNRRAEIGRPVPSNLGNAYSWYIVAQRAGLSTGLTPATGAVAVTMGGNHVSVVEAINSDGSFWISEMNSHGQKTITDPTPWGGWAVRNYKLFPASDIGKFKYIY